MLNPIDVKHTVAIFEKDGMFAAIGLYSANVGDGLHAVCSYDPRCTPTKSIYRNAFENRQLATNSFNENVAVTRDRGWTVVFNGKPNVG